MEFVQAMPVVLAASNTTEIIVGSLIIAIGAVVGLALLAKPELVTGGEGGWLSLEGSQEKIVSTVIRVVGLGIFVAGAWYGIGYFQQGQTLATIETSDQPIEAPAQPSDELHAKLMRVLKQIAPEQYSSIEVLGQQLILWKHPATKEIRIYSNNSITDAAGALDEDLPFLMKREHDIRLQKYDQTYPMLAYENSQEYIVPNIFPPPSGSAVYEAYQKFDPEATAPWKNLRIVYWLQLQGAEFTPDMVRRGHLRRWNKSPEELWSQSIKNLNRLFNEKKNDIEIERDGNVVTLIDPASLISAYPLSKNFNPVIGNVVGGGEFYFGIPTFSRIVMLSTRNKEDLPKLVEKVEEIAASVTTPISRNIFLSTPDGVEIAQQVDQR